MLDAGHSLYKYTSAAYAESILTEQYLWFSHVDKLNDPLECNIADFHYSTKRYMEDRAAYFQRRAAAHGFGSRGGPPNHFFDPIEGHGNAAGYIREQITQLEAQYHRYTAQRRRLYVLSLAETNLSPAMWSHYGDSFKGVCLKIDVHAMDRALGACPYPWKRFAVHYTVERPRLPYQLSADVDILIAHKHPDWSYEREIRYVVEIDPAEVGNAAGLRVPIGDAITEVQVADDTDKLIGSRVLAILGDERVRLITKSRRGWLEERPYRDGF